MTVLTTIDLRRLMKPALHPETYGCYIDILRTKNAIGSDFWATAKEVSFRLISTLAKEQESASILKLFDWEVYRKETWGLMTQRRRLDGLAVTTAGESGLRRHYGGLELEDVTMAVSLDLFGPSLFVIASERERRHRPVDRLLGRRDLGGGDLGPGRRCSCVSRARQAQIRR